MRDIWLLRVRALLARARGDDIAYRDMVNRYREMAESLGFEGHIDWAEAMRSEVLKRTSPWDLLRFVLTIVVTVAVVLTAAERLPDAVGNRGDGLVDVTAGLGYGIPHRRLALRPVGRLG